MKDCQCERCQIACQHRAGWLLPGEAEEIATYLGISLKELFDTRLGVDWWENDVDIFLLAPALSGSSSGTEYPANPRGTCVFYHDGQCDIHPVKPFECWAYHHDDTHQTIQRRHEWVFNQWINHQDQIEELLGREPIAKSFSFFDLLFGSHYSDDDEDDWEED